MEGSRNLTFVKILFKNFSDPSRYTALQGIQTCNHYSVYGGRRTRGKEDMSYGESQLDSEI